MVDEHVAPGPDLASVDLFAGYIPEREYARQRGVSLRTCQRDRALRKGPPFVVVGKQVYYRVAAVREWLLAQERSVGSKPIVARRGRGI